MNSSNAFSANYESVMNHSVDSLMAKIRNYSEDQLQALLNDEKRLSDMIDGMPQVNSLQSDKELKLAQSKSHAECNLSMEPKLNEQRATLQSAYEEAVRLKTEVEEMKQKLDSVAENRSLDTVLALLQAAAQQAEDESEGVAEKFQNGELDVDEFIRSFNEKRVTAHMRKVKAEKLAEILHQQQYQRQQQHYNSGAPYHSAYTAGYSRNSARFS